MSVKVVLASTFLPFILQPVEIDEVYYWTGVLWKPGLLRADLPLEAFDIDFFSDLYAIGCKKADAWLGRFPASRDRIFDR